MKNKILFIIITLLFSSYAYSQVLVRYDDMERPSSSTWLGVPILGSYTAGYSTNFDSPRNSPKFSSYDSCFIVYGIEPDTNTETETLLFPNINPASPGYEIKFNLASFGLDTNVNLGAGVDGADSISIEYSITGGTTTSIWYRTLVIRGANNLPFNAKWGFNGVGTNYTYTENQLRSLPGVTINTNPINPIISVRIKVQPMNGLNPIAYTQIRFRIRFWVNRSGETWMVDDVEIYRPSPLPIELLEFNGKYYNTGIKLFWSTATEINNDHFDILKSFDGINYFKIHSVNGRGNSNTIINYEHIDYDVCDTLVYYKLKQVDYDGTSKEYDPIAFRCRRSYLYDDFFDILGRKTRMDFDGIKIYQK